nr:MAG TPA: hypothetical protein [Caudoviricetes sp.]DAS56585.1 MAG TPA: hypothetical protein [Bacteriophage sp.]
MSQETSMTQENIQEVTKEEAEYQELQEHLDIIKALTDRARKDLIDCIKTIASRDKEALTEAAKSLAKNLLAVEQYSGNLAKELVTERIISSSLVNALDNLTKPTEEDTVPEEPKAKSINIIHPDADENVIARDSVKPDDLTFKEDEIDEIVYGNEEAKESSIDEKVTEAFDKVGTLVKEPNYKQWVDDIKEQLKNDTARSILGRKVYFIAANPLINESTKTSEDPNNVDITQYIEVIDAESLKYILVERRAQGPAVNDTILFEVDDQDVVEDHVFGRVNRHRYIGPDNKLTTLAKSLIKDVPNQHAFHHPYVVSSADC